MSTYLKKKIVSKPSFWAQTKQGTKIVLFGAKHGDSCEVVVYGKRSDRRRNDSRCIYVFKVTVSNVRFFGV